VFLTLAVWGFCAATVADFEEKLGVEYARLAELDERTKREAKAAKEAAATAAREQAEVLARIKAESARQIEVCVRGDKNAGFIFLVFRSSVL
jgi:hypothetical protein